MLPATTMEAESDDDPKGSTAVTPRMWCKMCGDVFDHSAVGPFPIGRLHPLNPLPRNGVMEQMT